MRGRSPGDDLYVYRGGLDYVYDVGGGEDTIWITDGRTINDITMVQDGNSAEIIVDNGVNEIYVNRLTHTNTSYHIEWLTFDNGFTADLQNYQDWVWGTSGDDTITAVHNPHTIIGVGGNNVLTGGAWDDRIHGGDGDDVIYGGDGDDWLWGGAGDDILHGGNGNDLLHGGEGADTFLFLSGVTGVDTVLDFTLSDQDVLDVSDLLGLYDPLQDAIADFVRFTADGGDTLLEVDESGSGSSFSTIAVLKDVTGLDEQALLTSGHLLVA